MSLERENEAATGNMSVAGLISDDQSRLNPIRPECNLMLKFSSSILYGLGLGLVVGGTSAFPGKGLY